MRAQSGHIQARRYSLNLAEGVWRVQEGAAVAGWIGVGGGRVPLRPEAVRKARRRPRVAARSLPPGGRTSAHAAGLRSAHGRVALYFGWRDGAYRLDRRHPGGVRPGAGHGRGRGCGGGDPQVHRRNGCRSGHDVHARTLGGKGVLPRCRGEQGGARLEGTGVARSVGTARRDHLRHSCQAPDRDPAQWFSDVRGRHPSCPQDGRTEGGRLGDRPRSRLSPSFDHHGQSGHDRGTRPGVAADGDLPRSPGGVDPAGRHSGTRPSCCTAIRPRA